MMVSRPYIVMQRQSGLGLVEIMIGLVIGMLAALIITQVVTDFEWQKRSTTGGSDTQTNGGVALYTLQGQIQSAGYGLPIFSATNQPLNCGADPTFINPAGVALGISPVTIIDGGAVAGASDTIVVRGSTPATAGMAGVPIAISSVGGSVVNVVNNLACTVNDTAIITNGLACEMNRVTGLGGVNQITLASAPANTTGDVSCMGVWSETTYNVSPATSRDMMVTQTTANDAAVVAPTPSVADIVNIQAQYGISAAPASNFIVAWVDASGAWAAPTPANRNLIKAVRVAVVARSGVYEKTAVTTACSSTTAAAPTGLCAWEGTAGNPAPVIDLSSNVDGTANPDWNRYRYRVFETVIPLRNIISSNGVL